MFLFLWYISDQSQVHKYKSYFFVSIYIHFLYIQEPVPTEPTFPSYVNNIIPMKIIISCIYRNQYPLYQFSGGGLCADAEVVVRMVVGTVFGVGFLGASQVLMVFGVASRHNFKIKKNPKSNHCSDFMYYIY